VRIALFSSALFLSFSFVACGSKTPVQPTTPVTPTPPAPVVQNAAPVPSAPAGDKQLDILRPTLTVTNGTSSQKGDKTYEFQVSDRSDFGPTAGSMSAYYTYSLDATGIAEGTDTTSFTADKDLQPATRFYWRARWVQGSTTSDWTPTQTLRTQVVGWNQAGEIYDPLFNGQMIAEFRTSGLKPTTFIQGKGLRIDSSDSYARYRARPAITA